MGVLARWLQHPLTRGVSLDDPKTTALRRSIIRSKRMLRETYRDWYGLIADSLPTGAGAVLELGSGAGFLPQVIPDVITSDVFVCPGARLVAEGQHLPFRDGSLRAITMVDVLHHIPDCRQFFADAARAVRPGGAVVAIEPWVTPWSRLVYSRFHHEPFLPEAAEWNFPVAGPLSGANQALPWIVFERDRGRFEREYAEWRIARLQPIISFRYPASGGVGLRSLMPGWTTPVVAGLEKIAAPFVDTLAMFALIVLTRTAP